MIEVDFLVEFILGVVQGHRAFREAFREAFPAFEAIPVEQQFDNRRPSGSEVHSLILRPATNRFKGLRSTHFSLVDLLVDFMLVDFRCFYFS